MSREVHSAVMYSQPPNSGPGNYPRTPNDRIRLREIAASQNQVMQCVLAQIGLIAARFIIVPMLPLFGFVIIAAALGLFVYMIISVVRLANALGASTVLYIVAMFVPCVSLLAMLSLSSQATAQLKQAGIAVGLLGANPETI